MTKLDTWTLKQMQAEKPGSVEKLQAILAGVPAIGAAIDSMDLQHSIECVEGYRVYAQFKRDTFHHVGWHGPKPWNTSDAYDTVILYAAWALSKADHSPYRTKHERLHVPSEDAVQ